MIQIDRFQVSKWEEELAQMQDKLYEAEKEVLCNSSVDKYHRRKEIDEYRSKREYLRLKIKNFELEDAKQELQETTKILELKVEDLNSTCLWLDNENSKLEADNKQIQKYSENLNNENENLQYSLQETRKVAYRVIGTLAGTLLAAVLASVHLAGKVNNLKSQFSLEAPKGSQSFERIGKEELDFSIISSEKPSYFRSFNLNKICDTNSAVIEYSNLSSNRKVFTVGRMHFPKVDCTDGEKDINGYFKDQNSNLISKDIWVCKGDVSFNQEKKMLYWTMKSEDLRCSTDAKTYELR
ncbi:MAG: hypothetical protein NW224_12805 [Leptolyngbyaceae cyanobacterium bins.302]|nr:hypothetical protein [Leptolyngbyaceae cyanobacterium bins.302]